MASAISENQQFAPSGAFQALNCKGRQCAKCGQCRDWYYTGDQTSWEWIRKVKNWKNDDCERWNNSDFCESFQRRYGAICSVHYGGYGTARGVAPFGIYYGHGLLHKGHDIDIGLDDGNDNDDGDDAGDINYETIHDIRVYDVCLCLCVDNRVPKDEASGNSFQGEGKPIMDEWPNLKTNEAKIVSHLDSLRDGLTEKTATKLSEYGSCQFWCFAEYNARGFENAFRSYLKLLLGIARLVRRSTFLAIFPKDCGGCAIAQLLCIVAMHPSLHSEVYDLLRELLCDENGRILQMLPDIKKMARMVQDAHEPKDHPFPYIGVCLNFARKSEAYKIMEAFGSMIKSDEFIQLMKNNSEKAIPVAQKLISNLENSSDSDRELSQLLKDI